MCACARTCIVAAAQGYLARLRREPIGVVAAVVPWNYPLLMAT
jgi:acyl-CoA reductase-like NAD-dependent aldehyde dehydrogenase